MTDIFGTPDDPVVFSECNDHNEISKIIDERIEYIKTKCKWMLHTMKDEDCPERIHIHEDDLRAEFLRLLSTRAREFTSKQIESLATRILSTSECAEGTRWYS